MVDKLLTKIVQKHVKNFEIHSSEPQQSLFVQLIVGEYLGALRKKKITIPSILEPFVRDDLIVYVKSMLYEDPSIDGVEEKKKRKKSSN